jgi:hypothetical protein
MTQQIIDIFSSSVLTLSKTILINNNSPSSLVRSLTKAVLTKDNTINNYTLNTGLKMSNTSNRRHIVVSPKNYDLLKNFGRASDSMNDAVTEVLRIASREGENPQRGIV